MVRPLRERLTYGPWQRIAFMATAVLLFVLGGLFWQASREPLAMLSAAICALGGVWIVASAVITRLDLSPDGFVLERFWRRRWSWADVEGFYVYHGVRGIDWVGYVPTPQYKETHRFARQAARLGFTNYALPALGMSAPRQVQLMSDWLRRYGRDAGR